MSSYQSVILEAAKARYQRETAAEAAMQARHRELIESVFPPVQPAPPKERRQRTRKPKPQRRTFDWTPWYPWLRRHKNKWSHKHMAGFVQVHTGHTITAEMVGSALQRLRRANRLKLG